MAMAIKTSVTKSEATTYFERSKGYFQDWPMMKYRLNIHSDDLNLDEAKEYEIVNFLHRFIFKKSIINDISLYSYWTIRSHDTLFSISDILYHSPYYFWIIVLLNNMTDPLYSWPMSEDQLYQHCVRKYGRDNLYKLHHYESGKSGDLYSLPVGHVVTPPPDDKTLSPKLVWRIKENITGDGNDPRSVAELLPAYAEGLVKPYQYTVHEISNYEFEDRENNLRKKIKLMKPQYLNAVVKEKNEIVKSSFIRTNKSLVRLK